MKKPRRNSPTPVEDKSSLAPVPLRPAVAPSLINKAALRAIRDDAARQHSNLRMMIAELNELSNEINATLAFLKAQRGDRS
jgi:hypothetical protein